MLSDTKRTLPSPSKAWTPPACGLNGSSFGPQLLVDQGQGVPLPGVTVPGGPFSGDLLLLILFRARALGGPEIPLPLSGSAQRPGTPYFPPAVPVSAGVAF